MATSIGLLLACELVARFVVGLGTPALYVEHPTIEYLLKPEQVVHPYGHLFSVNQYGMRSDALLEKQPGEFRVLVFGDSVINGGHQTDQAELATTILAEHLREQWGRPVTVGNVSAGSWGPGNWLAYAREYGFFDADALVLVVSSHDLMDNPTFAALDPATHPQHAPALAIEDGVKRLISHVGLYLRSRDESAAVDTASTPLQAGQGVRELTEFLGLARSRVRGVAVMPHPEQIELQAGLASSHWMRLQGVLGVQGIAGLPAPACWSQKDDASGSFYRDNIHLNPRGQAALAECLASVLDPFISASVPEQ